MVAPVRLHQLSMTAFGPFAGTEVVDFDELGAGGLFLLHGPTGAGKTSVLDAVCYALYGQLPGARSAGRPRLRSDHAGSDVEPRVRLELTVGGRRLEVTRTPEWSRPKKRGTGTTTAPASTHVRELVGGQWLPVTTRNDEAAQLLLDLLGMGHEQFTKVVLLPQGDFAAFLRADAEARRALLARLFAIDRWTGVETVLGDQRRRLAVDVDTARQHTGTLLARAGEAFAGLPDTDEMTEPAEVDAKASRQVSLLLDRALALQRAAQVEHEVRAEQAGSMHLLLDQARSLAARQVRCHDLTGQLRGLDETAADHAEAVGRIAAARRAAPLAGLVDALVVAAQRADAADLAARSARAAAAAVAGDLDEAGVRALLADHRTALGALTGAVAREADLTTTLSRIDTLHRDVADASRRGAAALTARETAGTDLTRARAAQQAAAVTAADLLPATAARDAAVRIAQHVVDLLHVGQAAAASRRDCEGAVDADQRAREHQLLLWERRVADLAAELAAGLAPGQPCSVCGSCTHPHPAAVGAEHVGRDAVAAATAAADAARVLREAAERHLADTLERRAELLAVTDGADAAVAQRDLLAAEARLGAATSATRAAQAETLAVAAATAALQQADLALASSADDAAVAGAALVELTASSSAAAADLDRLCCGDVDVAARTARLRGEVDQLEHLLDAFGAQRGTDEMLADQRGRLLTSCGGCGFDDVDAAVAALLPADDLERLALVVAARERERGDLVVLLADPGLAGVGDLPEPDLDRMTTQVAAADRELARAAARETLAREGVRRLTELVREVSAHEDATAPLLEQFDRIDGLTACVTGTGGDNTLRMRLSAYVLAARLEEVAAAATERLATMSGGRYALVHSDERVKGGGRSGLGLRVVDAWTGVERDTCTLSGGESFTASLALALGLADVVQAESGGTAIETLFVDEGFGTLDEETLDEVMTTLDGLRDGGRVVGLVSHVLDLRARIPTQLEVRKTRTGSTLVHRTAG